MRDERSYVNLWDTAEHSKLLVNDRFTWGNYQSVEYRGKREVQCRHQIKGE